LKISHTINRFFKSIFIRILNVFSRARICKPLGLGTINPSKILIVICDERMGELLLAVPLIRGIRSIFPNAVIHLLHAEKFTWLAGLIPGVEKTIPYNKRLLGKHPVEFAQILKDLRKNGFDLAIDAGKDDTASMTTALLMRVSGANIRLSHKRNSTVFFTHVVERGPEEFPEARRRLSLLRAFSDSTFSYSLEPLRELSPHLNPLPLGERKSKVGIYPGSRKPQHRIDPEVFVSVAKTLMDAGHNVTIIPGLGEESLCKIISEGSGSDIAPALYGEQLCRLFKTFDVIISNNTGPMHLSAALDVPTLGLFNMADPVRWGHSYPPHKTLDFTNSEPDAKIISETALEMINPSPQPSPQRGEEG